MAARARQGAHRRLAAARSGRSSAIHRRTGPPSMRYYFPRLRQPGRKRTPQRRPHGAVVGRLGRRRASPGQLCASVSMRSARRARDTLRRDRFRIAGGVESMTRRRRGQGDGSVPAQRRSVDTTIGWRFINPLMKAQYGVDAMGTARTSPRTTRWDARISAGAALAAACRQGDGGGLFRGGNRRRRDARRQGRTHHRRQGRTSAA